MYKKYVTHFNFFTDASKQVKDSTGNEHCRKCKELRRGKFSLLSQLPKQSIFELNIYSQSKYMWVRTL